MFLEKSCSRDFMAFVILPLETHITEQICAIYSDHRLFKLFEHFVHSIYFTGYMAIYLIKIVNSRGSGIGGLFQFI